MCVSHHGDGYDNCFCSIKIFFRQRGIKPNISLIFWGKGKGIKYVRKNTTKMMHSCSENKYWSDRRVFHEWANTHMRQISAERHTKEDCSKGELLILQYNRYVTVQKQYQDNYLSWYFFGDYIYDLYPTNIGTGNQNDF